MRLTIIASFIVIALMSGAVFSFASPAGSLSDFLFGGASLFNLLSGSAATVEPGNSAQTNSFYKEEPTSNVARSGHTATDLGGGKVLLVGGDGGAGTAEIFDLNSGTSSLTGSLSVSRAGHTATLLSDGRVLIAGGFDGKKEIASTEIFDQGVFLPGPGLIAARAGHTATVLSDGRILFVGGDAKGSIEILDAAAQSSQKVRARLNYPRSFHSAELLKSGDMLIVGGASKDGSPEQTGEILNLETMTFSAVDRSLHSPRIRPVLRELPDGKVQIIGGNDEGSMEMFTPDGNYFSAFAHVIPGRDARESKAFKKRDAKGQDNYTLENSGASEAESEVLKTETRAALINKGEAEDSLLNRSDYSLVKIRGLNKVLVTGGKNSESETLKSSITFAESEATVTTDKLDYPPGETVTITGTGWEPGETVKLTIVRDRVPTGDGQTDTIELTATADADGNFVNTDYSTTIEDLGASFVLTAVGQTSGRTAQTTFTDSHSATSVKPNGGPTSGGTAVDINGSSFTSGATFTVTFGSASPVSATRQNSTRLTTTTPVHGAGTVNVVVTETVAGVPNTSTITNGYTYICNANNQVFLETMGTVGGNTAISAHETANGFDNDSFTMTGTGDVRISSASSPTTDYTVASGAANVFLTNTGGGTNFQIAGVNTTGLSNLELSFGIFKNANTATGSDLIVEVSSDGTTYTALSYPNLPTSSSGWFYRIASGSIPATANLRIRFRNTGVGGTQYRIDDVRLGNTVTVNPTDQTVNSGATASFTASRTNSTVQWQVSTDGGASFSNISGETSTTLSFTASTSQNGYKYRAVFTDSCSLTTFNSTAATLTVNASNAAPTVNRDNATVTINEGATAANTGTYSDTNTGDNVAISASPIGTVTKTGTNSGTWSWSYPTADNAATQTVTITADDGAGGVSTTTFDLTVNNVAPTATFNAPASVDQNAALNISLTDPVDPGTADTLTYAFDCGDGAGYGAFGASSSASCSTATSGTRTVKGKVRDDDGGETEYTQSVTVRALTSVTLVSGTGTYGGNATLTAKLTSGATNLSGKTVSFTYNGNPAGMGTTDANGVATATLSLTGVNAGSYTGAIGASFAGDTDYAGSSGSGALTVNQRNTTTSVSRTAGANPSNVGASVTFTATVAGMGDGAGDPTNGGTVQFYDGATALGTAQNLSGGAASISTSALTAGSHSITAVYSGDTNFNTSTSGALAHSVNTPPVAVDDAYDVNEEGVLNIPASGVLGNDTDADTGTTLTVATPRPITAPTNGSLTLNADGSFTYTPNANFSGSDTFTYKANDGVADSGAATVTITVNAVNDAPSFTKGADQAVAEDAGAQTAANWATNISAGPANESTQVVDFIVSNDNNSLFAVQPTVSPTGTLSYTPAANANGSATVSVQIHDDGGTANSGANTSAVQTFNITVSAVNDAPTADDGGTTTDEDTAAGIDLGALVSDVETSDANLTYTIVNGPASGNLSGSGANRTYTPNSNFNGQDSFTYQVTDRGDPDNCGAVNASCTAALSSAVKTFTITVNAVNDVPVAVDDSASTNEDNTLNVNAANGVLSNDTDVEGNTLTAVLVSATTNGSLMLNLDGSFSYTPNANYNGQDSFTYKANDGTADSNVATVTITVNPVNDAPDAVDDTESTDEDTPADFVVLDNDTDVDGDTLSITGVTQGTKGSVAVNPNGTIAYTPNANANGADSFTYTISDGNGGSDTATVNVTINAVNDVPTAANDNYNVDEDNPLAVNAASGVLNNDNDVEGDSLSAILVDGTDNGLLTLNADGSFSYTPTANFNGQDSFTYKANDGSLDSNVATVTITVNAVNDEPVLTNPGNKEVDEETQLNFMLAANDVDSGQTLSYSIQSGSESGMNLNAGTGAFSWTPTEAQGPGVYTVTFRVTDDGSPALFDEETITITVKEVNSAPVANNDTVNTNEDTPVAVTLTASDSDVPANTVTYEVVTGPANGILSGAAPNLTYTPNANYFGGDSFTFKANDGTVDSNTATITINVASVNDDPTANDDSATVAEDSANNPINVLANDSIAPDTGETLSVTAVTQPTNGTAAFTAGGVTYTPAANYHGSDSFTYTIGDGNGGSATATVNVTVTPVNDAPVAQNDAASTDEDSPLVISAPGVLGNDSDVDGDSLTAVVVSTTTNGLLTLNADGSFTYTPNANYNGSDSFTYKANDGTADSNTATVTITVNPVNDAPVAVDDNYNVNEDNTLTIPASGVLGNDSDIEGNSLTAILVSGVSHGSLTLNPDGSFSYTPDTNYNGGDSFTYKANDGSADSNIVTVSITVNPVNDAPTADAQSVATDEDTALGITLTGSDIDGDGLTYTVVTNPANGVLSGAAPNLTYTPNTNYNGSDSFTFKVNDGTVDSNIATISITVNAVNDAPTAVNYAGSTDEDTALNIPAPGVLVNDTDVEGDTLTAVLVSTTAHGTLTLNSDGSFNYVPDANYHGPDSFTYKANDGTADSNTATVTITVNPVNDAPVANNGSATTNEDTPKSITLSASDVDGDGLTYTIVSGPSHGTLSNGTGASRTYTPNANYFGPDSFTFKVNDGTVDSNVATFSITVDPQNDAPVASNNKQTQNVQYSDPIDTVTISASDVDSHPLTATASGLPNGVTLSVANCTASGLGTNCTWTVSGKANDAPATYNVIVTVKDGANATKTTNFSITVYREDARATYTGLEYVTTSSAGATSANVVLSATIQDITAVDSASDPNAGDIRNARVSFVNRDSGNAVLCSNLTPSLVNASDTKTGTVGCTVNLNVGNTGATPYRIGIIVNHYYTRDNSDEDTIVTVAQPVNSMITGGGYIVNAASSGVYAGGLGLKTNFGFNVKYNKNMTNLQGNVNIIIRASDGKIYQIKSNAMNSLQTKLNTGDASFESKANLSDITDQNYPVSLGGNLNFQMVMKDNGEPGTKDLIGFTLRNSSGALLFSSNWDGIKTIQQNLRGGNLAVR